METPTHLNSPNRRRQPRKSKYSGIRSDIGMIRGDAGKVGEGVLEGGKSLSAEPNWVNENADVRLELACNGRVSFAVKKE
jgi:hypothetical protein